VGTVPRKAGFCCPELIRYGPVRCPGNQRLFDLESVLMAADCAGPGHTPLSHRNEHYGTRFRSSRCAGSVCSIVPSAEQKTQPIEPEGRPRFSWRLKGARDDKKLRGWTRTVQFFHQTTTVFETNPVELENANRNSNGTGAEMWACKLLKKMVARDGLEPPTPAFSGLRSTN
jgi:hypothetical protein